MSIDDRETERLRVAQAKPKGSDEQTEDGDYADAADDSAVWTSAERIPYESALPPEMAPLEPEPAQEKVEDQPTAVAESHEEKRFHFRRFMEDLSSMENPTAEVEGLSRFASDENIVGEAVVYLQEVARNHAERGQLVEELIYAMAGVVHLRASEARPILESMVQAALEQLESIHALPQLEEHCALAAMEGLKVGQFHGRALFEEYDAMVGQTADVMDREGEAAAVALVAYHAGRYRERIREVLGMTPAPRALDAVPTGAPPTAQPVAEPAPSNARPVEVKEEPRAQPEPTLQSETEAPMENVDPYGRLKSPARATLQIEPEMYEDVTGADFAIRGGGLPWYMSLSALVAGGAGLAFSILSYKLGSVYLAIGLLWIVGAIGLVADRKAGFFLGLATFLINGGALAWCGLASELPVWLAPAGLVVTGGVAIMIGLLLLHPNLRARFRQRAW